MAITMALATTFLIPESPKPLQTGVEELTQRHFSSRMHRMRRMRWVRRRACPRRPMRAAVALTIAPPVVIIVIAILVKSVLIVIVLVLVIVSVRELAAKNRHKFGAGDLFTIRDDNSFTT